MTQPNIRPFALADSEAVIAIWEACQMTVPWNDPHKDITRKRQVNPELFLVAEAADGRILGTVMGGYEGHRGWINYQKLQLFATVLGQVRNMQSIECPFRANADKKYVTLVAQIAPKSETELWDLSKQVKQNELDAAVKTPRSWLQQQQEK